MNTYTLWNSFRKNDKDAGRLNGRIFNIYQDKETKKLTFVDPFSQQIIHQTGPLLRHEVDPAGIMHYTTQSKEDGLTPTVYSIINLKELIPTVITVEDLVTNGYQGEPI